MTALRHCEAEGRGNPGFHATTAMDRFVPRDDEVGAQ
jgi:hypothetical protein